MEAIRIRKDWMPLLAMLVWLSFSGFAAPARANPALTPGVWKNITPSSAQVDRDSNIFCQGMAIDPSHPSTLYLGICAFDVAKPVGLYKSIDAGSTWRRVGNLDEPVHVVVDPKNSNHLYCVDGVRGNTIGFWISNDGGETWTKPAGFLAATANPVGTQDLYSIATDPGDFNHVLVSFHSPWSGMNNAGVLESKDGGMSWMAHNPPAGSLGGYGMAIFFLDYPQHGMGDAKTWLFTAQAGGFFRTSDGGASWSQVFDKQMTHGGNQIYCSKTGVLYSGGYQYPARSTDNGLTWTQIKTGLDYSWYMGVSGDGVNLYIGNTGTHRPIFVSPESDGLTWTAYQGGAQTFDSEPFEMFYDSANGIMYSANWEGLYALKVISAGNAVLPRIPARQGRNPRLVPSRNGMQVEAASGARFTLPGRKVAAAISGHNHAKPK
ncbi:MAG: hypothetical protein ABI036_05420 [Fibrobacteria bacterium]